MIQLSIIVPVFNVAPYVERCIRSLESQDIPNNDFEIICINDGSTDNSRGIIQRLQNEFSNIILIDQMNQGASNARNNGMDRAAGRYLMFIDSDDYVDKNSFASILQNAVNHRAQVSFLGFTILNEDGTVRKRFHIGKQLLQIYPGTEAYFLARGDGPTDADRMVAVLFEKDFINRYNLRYLPNVPYLEDGEFVARILCLAERCIFHVLSFYQRTNRQGSATNSNLFYSDKASKGFLLAAYNLKRFQQEQNLNKKQRNFLNQPVCKFVICAIDSAQKPFSLKNINEVRARLAESGLSKLNLASVKKEYARLGYFYNRSLYLLMIYQFLTKCVKFIRFRINKIRV
jgi:glycosyltransferase involved in cell wall biosynthesis